jgi:hypothetical protein
MGGCATSRAEPAQTPSRFSAAASLRDSAIPASYPLHGAFDFDPDVQRALFEFAATCAATDRLWIRAYAGTGNAAGEQPAAASAPICPADDFFMGHLC